MKWFTNDSHTSPIHKSLITKIIGVTFCHVSSKKKMGENGAKRWNFGANEVVVRSNSLTIRDYLNTLISNLDGSDVRPVIPLGHGDPSPFPSFRTDQAAVEAICDAVRSTKFNNYSASSGVPVARK